MVIQVFLIKRSLQERRRNGQRRYRWALRWVDPQTGKWRYETTGTADRTEAEALKKAKWATLNGLTGPIEARPQLPRPSWEECRGALERAMQADNLRPSSIEDSLHNLDSLQRLFPKTISPADITFEMANEFKRRRAETGNSSWTVRGDLASLHAIYGKWLIRECGLLQINPFAGVRPPRCDEPEIRIVLASETEALFNWLSVRWNNWQLPLTYLQIAALLGWRATEIASIREEDVLRDGYVRVTATSCKTRKTKYGWLPAELHQQLRACAAGGWAFGRFSDELRRLLLVWQHRPHHAIRVREFAPGRLVGWLQDELQRFNESLQKAENQAAAEAGRKAEVISPFTLHDFRRTAITGLQMAGVSEKDVSIMVGATPEVIRKHYERMDRMTIARRSVERRLGVAATAPATIKMSGALRAGCARDENGSLDDSADRTQTIAG